MNLLDCVPYSENACKVAGQQLNLELSVGSYTQKGCYTYNNGEHPGKIWYGTGGSEDKISGSTGYNYMSRPPGFDCRTGSSQRRSNVWLCSQYDLFPLY